MALADAFGQDAPYDPGQGVDDLARQVFPDYVQESQPVDPGRPIAVLVDRKTWHVDENPTEVNSSSSYGELVIKGSKPSSFSEVVKPRGPAIIEMFWNAATSSTALCFDAAVLLAVLVVGDFSLVRYLPVIGPYVPVARLVTFLVPGSRP
jgi:hypothetical protein